MLKNKMCMNRKKKTETNSSRDSICIRFKFDSKRIELHTGQLLLNSNDCFIHSLQNICPQGVITGTF